LRLSSPLSISITPRLFRNWCDWRCVNEHWNLPSH